MHSNVLNIDSYGMEELDMDTAASTVGGSFILAVAASLVAVVIYDIANDMEGAVKAFKDGYNAVAG